MTRRGRRALGVVLVAGLLAVSACDPGAEEGTGTNDPEVAEEEDLVPTDSSTLIPRVRECPETKRRPDGELGDMLLSDADLTQATWDMPQGFQEASGYYEDNPVEPVEEVNWIAEPIDGDVPRLNVASLVVYSGLDWGGALDEACGLVPEEIIRERLAGYRGQIGAQELSEPEVVEIDGHPVVTQRLRLSSYDYVGYWLFSRQNLLHLYCQWTDDQYEEVIAGGCAEIAAGMRVP